MNWPLVSRFLEKQARLHKSISHIRWAGALMEANNLQIICKQPANNLQYTRRQSVMNKLQSNLPNLSLLFYLYFSLQAHLCLNELGIVPASLY